MNNFQIREAVSEDVPAILKLVKCLAEYVNLIHEVTAVEELFKKNGFSQNQYFNCLILENQGKEAIGFALYFFNFSTFTGKPTLYLEDIFVLPEYRNKGLGKNCFKKLLK
ncbi:MAG: GNAT family N-acetyltransferase [Candidatus Caenarcaniphilales bacterium]|nr:GNAT family N-acetyltransferase [Candidatus Caenarcaniphilales bacterium]